MVGGPASIAIGAPTRRWNGRGFGGRPSKDCGGTTSRVTPTTHKGSVGPGRPGPGPLERVGSPLLRRMYPLALQRMLDTQGISRLKQIIRSRGWPGSLK